jgi:ribosome-binding protein aMBF1 (putative translation factor)
MNILFWDIFLGGSTSPVVDSVGRGMRKSVHTKAQQAFCRVIIDARKKAGLTQTEVADRLGKPQSFIAKIEAGERRVDVIELLAVASVLGVNPETLVSDLRNRLK